MYGECKEKRKRKQNKKVNIVEKNKLKTKVKKKVKNVMYLEMYLWSKNVEKYEVKVVLVTNVKFHGEFVSYYPTTILH